MCSNGGGDASSCDTTAPELDCDDDGYSNGAELACGDTDPSDSSSKPDDNEDCDSDGYSNGVELACGDTDPSASSSKPDDNGDCDDDGYRNGVELACGDTDPNDSSSKPDDNEDCDSDGYSNGVELACGDTDPSASSSKPDDNEDCDSDGYSNGVELACDTSLIDVDSLPNNPRNVDPDSLKGDSDGDGTIDCDDSTPYFSQLKIAGSTTATLEHGGTTSVDLDCNANSIIDISSTDDFFNTPPMSDCNNNGILGSGEEDTIRIGAFDTIGIRYCDATKNFLSFERVAVNATTFTAKLYVSFTGDIVEDSILLRDIVSVGMQITCKSDGATTSNFTVSVE